MFLLFKLSQPIPGKTSMRMLVLTAASQAFQVGISWPCVAAAEDSFSGSVLCAAATCTVSTSTTAVTETTMLPAIAAHKHPAKHKREEQHGRENALQSTQSTQATLDGKFHRVQLKTLLTVST
eukprot:scpid46647/ scgid24811/ 